MKQGAMRRCARGALLLFGCIMAASGYGQEFMSAEAFSTAVFPDGVPAPQVLWLTGARREAVTQILGHAPETLRVRYWAREGRSAWMLDEIGKERPISAGVVVRGNQIESLRILAYREERGGEVVNAPFLRQFQGAHLGGGNGLDRPIDGITGATLSVDAVSRMAREALYLASQLPQ